jgi:hypothetical protein
VIVAVVIWLVVVIAMTAPMPLGVGWRRTPTMRTRTMMTMGRMSVRAAGGVRWAKEAPSSTKAHHRQTRLLLLVEEVGAVWV